MSAKLDAARRILATATRLPESAIPDGAAIGTLDAWDSLAHVRLISTLEEAVGEPLSPEEIVAIARLGDVATFLERRGR